VTRYNALNKVDGYLELLIVRVITSIILWVDFTLIFSMLSYRWHAEPETIGFTAALYGLPGLFLGPFFGRLADRVNPATMLLFSYLARGGASIALTLATDIHLFTLLVFVKGLSNLGAMPAEQLVTRYMLSRNQLIINTSIVTVIDQISKVCSPLIGSLMAQVASPNAGFVISSILGVLGALVVVRLRMSARIEPNSASSTGNQMFTRDFFDFFIKNTNFRLALVATICQTGVLAFYDPLLAALLIELGFPAGTFGVIVSFTAGGAIIGAIIFKNIFSKYDKQRLFGAALCGFGLSIIIPSALIFFNGPLNIVLLAIFWTFNGCFFAQTAMSFTTIIQIECPAGILGAVSSTARSLQLATMVTGPIVGSSVARATSIPFVFAASGLVAVAVGTVLLAAHRTRNSQSGLAPTGDP